MANSKGHRGDPILHIAKMAAMRIAIAGSNSLAIAFAFNIQQQTNYQFVILSREERPNLVARGFPVLVVDYDDPATLQHALLGVDVVISTVTGNPQINLIHAAVLAGVSRFVPAEFGPTVNFDTATTDPLDRGRAEAVQWLQYYRGTHGIEYCLFLCGLLYERFDQGGLLHHGLGVNTGIAGEGDFLINVRNLTVEAPYTNANGEDVHICLTSMRDLATFVVRALGMREWPFSLTVFGERLSVESLVETVEDVRSFRMQSAIQHNMSSLVDELRLANALNNTLSQQTPRETRALYLIATAMGRFDVSPRSRGSDTPTIRPLRFRDWLAQQWG